MQALLQSFLRTGAIVQSCRRNSWLLLVDQDYQIKRMKSQVKSRVKSGLLLGWNEIL